MSVVAPAPAASFAPPCPVCRTPLAGLDAGGEEGEGLCSGCATLLRFRLFPARRRAKPVARAVSSGEGDATCFFHAQNQAAGVCDECGRYLCSVCEVAGEEGQKLCPPCVGSRRRKSPAKKDELVTYDTFTLRLALFPLLMWPLTILTAPATLVLIVYGWRKPRSLVRGGTWRLVVAGLIALAQIGGWTALGVGMWLNT